MRVRGRKFVDAPDKLVLRPAKLVRWAGACGLVCVVYPLVIPRFMRGIHVRRSAQQRRQFIQRVYLGRGFARQAFPGLAEPVDPHRVEAEECGPRHVPGIGGQKQISSFPIPSSSTASW